jgi:prevent-host-death family protein
MPTSLLSITQVNQNFSRARKAIADGPVVITDRGEPAMVLMSYADYKARMVDKRTLLERIDVPGTEGINLEIPSRTSGGFEPADFS